MLVNCPKCGFTQPKDRYCAKCGVDMENFKPAEIALGSRILGHPALHIGVIFIVVFLVVAYIKGREKESFLSQVEKIPSGVARIERSAAPALTVETATASSQTERALTAPAPPAATSAVPDAKPVQAVSLAPQNSASLAVADPAGSASEESRRPLKVRVIYAEVDDLTLKKWVPEMQAAGLYSETDVRMGMLPNIERKMAEDRSIVTLETVSKSFDRLHPNADWFNGKVVDSQEIGLKTNLRVMDPDSAQLKAEMRIQRGGNAPIDAEIELPPKAGWVIWKVLDPQRPPRRDFLSDMKSFFQIYNSPRFKNGRSDFTILLVFDTPSAR